MLFPLWYCILIDSILYPMIKSIVSLLIRGWYFPCNHLGSSWAVILTCYRVHKCVVVITLNCAIPLGNFRELNWMVSGFSFPFQGLIANHLYIDGNVSDSGRVFFFFFFCGFANCIFSLPYSTCIDQVFIFYFVKKQDLPR